MRVALLAALLFAAAPAEAQVVLRLASSVPEGTAWAREGMAFARDVEALTHGEVRIKWYLGGIAGDELQVGERIRRDQLDGVGSGGILCGALAPSMQITRAIGLFRNRDESAYVMGRLKPELDEEFRKSGFTNLWEALLGPQILFTRAPVRSLADLVRGHFWIWGIDDVLDGGLRGLGVQTLPLPLERAGRAYEEGQHDGFITLPTAALAFQWSAQVRYVSALPTSFLTGCLIVANRAFDPLSPSAQEAIRAAAAKFQARMEEVGRQQDQVLLDRGAFQRQGLQLVPVSDAFFGEYFEAARSVREKQGAQLVSPALLARINSWLAAYRAEHSR
jgi:TRAP-type C4-dicarboxylate transport system substrate-binding protein